tara:strand:+ start:651 stop:755 length:105 start_codon:yes stop_codon:yes gene_type:complete
MGQYFFGGRLPDINYENYENILEDPIKVNLNIIQ